MPRPRNKDACNTCRRRKVKCSLDVPICSQCRAAGRYCDRSETPATFVPYQHEAAGDGHAIPRDRVKDPPIARLFHSYISSISTWYDLSDAVQSFSIAIPRLALDEPLLFHAIIALSAMHACKTSTEGSLVTAQHHHTECVRLLIALDAEDELVRTGMALVAACLLRSYEILGGDTDRNIHLRGAYSMASLPRPLSAPDSSQGLAETGFWNYLREDITFSLYERCPLKMDLEQAQHVYEYRSDEDYLNLLTMVLGRIINTTFGDQIIPSQWVDCVDAVCWSFGVYPKHMLPFARAASLDSSPFPVVWFARPCHAAAMHYYLVALFILVDRAPEDEAHLLAELDFMGHYRPSRPDQLSVLAAEISGIAFTAKTPAVIVNAFGPIAYSCRFLQGRSAQDELERQLTACKKAIGWPVERLIETLKVSWQR